jgi:hypothetical protein
MRRLTGRENFGPRDTLSAWHDGEGWCIRVERPGGVSFCFGGYGETARDVHWLAGEFAKSCGCRVVPLRLN